MTLPDLVCVHCGLPIRPHRNYYSQTHTYIHYVHLAEDGFPEFYSCVLANGGTTIPPGPAKFDAMPDIPAVVADLQTIAYELSP